MPGSTQCDICSTIGFTTKYLNLQEMDISTNDTYTESRLTG